MDIPHTPFEEWRPRHMQELIRDYRQYLRDILEDDGFDIRHVEDFDAWTLEEYDMRHDYADETDT